MAVEQKFKVLQKADIEIYRHMNSHLRNIGKNSAEFCKFVENPYACTYLTHAVKPLLYVFFYGRSVRVKILEKWKIKLLSQ